VNQFQSFFPLNVNERVFIIIIILLCVVVKYIIYSSPFRPTTWLLHYGSTTVVDFLPSGFSGETLKREHALAHWLSFTDYLRAHELHNPADAATVNNVVSRFQLRLCKAARLWIDGKVFETLDQLKTAFVNRFSAQNSHFANMKLFDGLTNTPGESADIYLNRVRLVAASIGYGDDAIKNKFITTLPNSCQENVIMSAPDGATPDQIARLAQKCLEKRLQNVRPMWTMRWNDTRTPLEPFYKSQLS
jgi:hypothetical protein